MKRITLLLLLLILVYSGYSKQIDENSARQVAKTYFNNVLNTTEIASTDFVLSDKFIDNASLLKDNSPQTVYFYIFNLTNNNGFIIVSGDDNVEPVLGYSTKGNYSNTNLSPEFSYWLEGYKKQIKYVIENKVNATETINQTWNNLIQGTYSLEKSKQKGGVAPLINTTWDQGNNGGFYNDLCPNDHTLPNNCNNSQHCVTGCPATAMAQIMKFWNYPSQGTGFHSYSSNYGNLSANFANTTYNWGNMPFNKVTSTNIAVATLMFHCGVAVEMSYGPCGSGGYVIAADGHSACSENAYTNYFGYNSTTIQGLRRSSYSDTDWKNLLKTELDNGRPVQYAGYGSNGGHTFVCDGYDARGFFDMNWGWGGYYDGFFNIDALNPATDNFNSNQEALIGIQPIAHSSTTTDIQVNSNITVTPNPINFGKSFTVNADVINAGNSNFNGEYCAALFNSTGDFIDYVETQITGSYPLLPNYHYTNGITFTNPGMLTVPGNYVIGIFYRPTDGNWILAGNSSFPNLISISINGPYNPLEQYSDIIANPSTFVQGQAASINVNLLNKNNYTYYGTYSADLYDLNGYWVENIGTYDETKGLPYNYEYQYPYISFSTTAITSGPGTYILGIAEEPQGTSNYYLVGDNYYKTPININIVSPTLNPDMYEPNDTITSSYNLPLNWNNDAANPKTTGSNLHIQSDIDYYKINLAAGYDYIITARVDDSYSSNDGNTYSCDVIWSYNSGTGWSDTYDDVMPGNIIVKGGGTVAFLVSPYLEGLTGTYLLDISISRVVSTGINESGNMNEKPGINVYPNPTSGFINIKSSGNIHFDNLQIINFMGQIVAEIKPIDSFTQINISNFSNGVYYLEAIDNEKTYYRKFIINK